MSEAKVFESLMQNKDVQFEVDDRIEQAYRQGFEAGQAQYEEKHWNECRQISEYDAENKALKEILSEAVDDLRITIPDSSRCETCALFDKETTDCKDDTMSPCRNVCRWRLYDEAMKLIGGEDDA